MANEIPVKVGGQIRFFETGTFSPADAGTNHTIGTPTDVVLKLGSDTPIADGLGRQSAKFDFGATRAPAYELLGCVDFTGETPSATGSIDYYLAPSTSTTVMSVKLTAPEVGTGPMIFDAAPAASSP